MMEMTLMARYCCGLIHTRSNVAVVVMLLSDRDFKVVELKVHTPHPPHPPRKADEQRQPQGENDLERMRAGKRARLPSPEARSGAPWDAPAPPLATEESVENEFLMVGAVKIDGKCVIIVAGGVPQGVHFGSVHGDLAGSLGYDAAINKDNMSDNDEAVENVLHQETRFRYAGIGCYSVYTVGSYRGVGVCSRQARRHQFAATAVYLNIIYQESDGVHRRPALTNLSADHKAALTSIHKDCVLLDMGALWANSRQPALPAPRQELLALPWP